MMAQFLPLLFALLIGHALADGWLQDNRMSRAKRPGGDPLWHWRSALSRHAIDHGALVVLVLGVGGFAGVLWLGAAEAAAHGAIDWAKSRGRIGTSADQLMHVACKLAWAGIAVAHG